MNGLDPAGMHDMRDMISALVAEGRTVMLSSHLLDEVERTCDAVAIVDQGSVIRQGSIAELLSGASVVLQVECSDNEKANTVLGTRNLRVQVITGPSGLDITLPAGAGRDLIAEVARILVDNGIDLYRLQPVQTSLESWFLEVTSRLGESR
jgi:ABC-2 type transport system ATP-binding protein